MMEKIPVIINDQEILSLKGATILEVALANNIYIPHLCYHPDLKPAGICRLCLVELEDRTKLQNLRFHEESQPPDISNPFFVRNLNKCVLCGICVRTCQEIQKVNAIDFVGRGYSTKVAPFGDKAIAGSRCVSCGECVVGCPVGALVEKNFRRPSTEIKTVCPYCSVGRGMD